MKKTLIISSSLILFALFMTACTATEEAPVAQEKTPQELSVEAILDNETVIEAIETQNLALCDTLETSEQISDCKTKVADRGIMDEVRETGDSKKCNNVKEDDTKEKCIIIAEQRTAELKAQAELEEQNNERDAQLAEDEANLEAITNGEAPTPEDCEVIKDPVFKEGCLISAGAIPSN